MLPQHANAAKIACIEHMGGRNDAGEGNRLDPAKSKPPVPLIKFGNGSRIKERQLMKFSKRCPQRHLQFHQPRESDTSVAPDFEIIVSVSVRPERSFAERGLDAEPHGPDEAGYDHRDDCLESVALRLFDAPAPAPKMLKIRAQLFSIFFVDSKGVQRRRDGFENQCIDIVVTNPLLFGQSRLRWPSRPRLARPSSLDDPCNILKTSLPLGLEWTQCIVLPRSRSGGWKSSLEPVVGGSGATRTRRGLSRRPWRVGSWSVPWLGAMVCRRSNCLAGAVN